jgi:UDP-3-O-[3-hydroxymyristoyl] glucosamine N-acyltransferase
MSQPVFFERGRALTVAEILELTGARAARSSAAELRITDVAALERAGPGDLAFAEGRAIDALRLTQAAACFIRQELAAAVPNNTIALIVDEPYRALVRVAAALYPDASRPSSLFDARGIDSRAVLHPTARIEAGVIIDPAAVIGPHAEIGAGTLIGPMAVIGPSVRIGRDCVVGAGASVTHALLGDRVVIQPGCRIGHSAAEHSRALESPALGRVILQDRVEIGPNCMIGRGRHGDTIIGEATVVDALVEVRPDAAVGRYCRVRADNGLHPANESDESDIPFADHAHHFASELGAPAGHIVGARG